MKAETDCYCNQGNNSQQIIARDHATVTVHQENYFVDSEGAGRIPSGLLMASMSNSQISFMQENNGSRQNRGFLRGMIEALFSKLKTKAEGGNTAENSFEMPSGQDFAKQSVQGRMMNGAERKAFTDTILRALKDNAWIHIYGELLCGKTQILLSAAERLADYEYMDIARCTAEYIFQKTCAMKRDSVLILDGIHLLTLDFEKSAFWKKLLEVCERGGIKIISSGKGSLRTIFWGTCYEKAYAEFKIPGLKIEEIREILQKNGIASGKENESMLERLSSFYGNAPAIIMEIVYLIKEDGKNLQDAFFSALFSESCGTTADRIEELIHLRIQEEETRELLYRIGCAGDEMKENVIREIANLEPRISEADEKIMYLKDAWLTENRKKEYSLRKSARHVAENKISSVLQKKIHETVARSYENRTLSYYEFVNLLCHYHKAEQYDQEGITYFQYLQFLLHNDQEHFCEYGIDFWMETPMPPMNSGIKAMCRIAQLQYLAKYGRPEAEKAMKFVKELILSEENRTLLGLYACMIAMYHSIYGIELLKLCQENNAWGILPKEYQIALWDKNIGLKGMTLGFIIAQIHTVAEGEALLDLMESWDEKDCRKFLEGKFLLTCWRSIWEKIRLESQDGYELEAFLLRANKICRKLSDALYVETLACWLRYWGENRKDRETAKAEYQKWIGDFAENSRELFRLIDVMGKQLLDLGDEAGGMALLEKRIDQAGVEEIEEEDVFDLTCTCIAVLNRYLSKDASYPAARVERAQEMLLLMVEITENADKNQRGELSDRSFPFPRYFKEKILGEYYMSMYLSGKLEYCFDAFAGYSEQLVKSAEKGEQEARKLAAVLSHCLGYIFQDIVNKKKPQSFGAEKYAAPHMRMFWGFNRPEELLHYDTEERRCAVRMSILELAVYYEKKEIVHAALLQALKGQFWRYRFGSAMCMLNPEILVPLIYYNRLEPLEWAISSGIRQAGEDLGARGAEFYSLRIMLAVTLYLCRCFECQGVDKMIEECQRLGKLFLRLSQECSSCLFKEYGRILTMLSEEGLDYGLLHETLLRVQVDKSLAEMDRVIAGFFLMSPGKMDVRHIRMRVKEACDYFHFRSGERILKSEGRK